MLEFIGYFIASFFCFYGIYAFNCVFFRHKISLIISGCISIALSLVVLIAGKDIKMIICAIIFIILLSAINKLHINDPPQRNSGTQNSRIADKTSSIYSKEITKENSTNTENSKDTTTSTKSNITINMETEEKVLENKPLEQVTTTEELSNGKNKSNTQSSAKENQQDIESENDEDNFDFNIK